jgi:preprotein translocase subunit SecF
MKLGTAGIAAFLMLIGYSVDTNILLSTKVIKRKEGTVLERIFGAMKTGLMMSTTTICAITVALIFTQSEVIRQIMTILLIGLLVDLVNTWIQNVGILRIYLERKHKNVQA